MSAKTTRAEAVERAARAVLAKIDRCCSLGGVPPPWIHDEYSALRRALSLPPDEAVAWMVVHDGDTLDERNVVCLVEDEARREADDGSGDDRRVVPLGPLPSKEV